jgi:hypothetical protein
MLRKGAAGGKECLHKVSFIPAGRGVNLTSMVDREKFRLTININMLFCFSETIPGMHVVINDER